MVGERKRGLKALFAVMFVLGGFGFVAAPVIGDGLNRGPEPATPRIAMTVPATEAQVAGAGINLPSGAVSAKAKTKAKKKKKKARNRPVMMRSRITTDAIVTEEHRGTYVGVRCPAGSKAVAGGVLSQYINLLVSSSAPNNPLTGKFTPRVWWITVTNANIDGQGGSLAWRGVVTCLSPVALGS
ncbi:MAG: hypothetical protein M3Y45_01880 [Actinomycetota bacterium]|nr:hypothetical protein [Actinomycetota bacterium]